MALLQNIFRPKKSADHALQDLVAGLQQALGGNLQSVIAFGSFVTGEFNENRSNLNVLVLTTVWNQEVLTQASAPVTAWIKSGHVTPIFLRADELPAMARILPIEFFDIVDHHRVLVGSDPFANFQLDTQNLDEQVQHDLATLLVKLRRAAVEGQSNPALLARVLTQSLSSVWTLCRALVRLHKGSEKLSKLEAGRQIAEKAGVSPEFIHSLEAFRQTSRTPAEAQNLFPAYLELVEKLLHYAEQVPH